jgi:hypothetical protein
MTEMKTAMKTLKVVLILILFSIQAGATGYSHNMFVAHKKLQAGKEVVQEKVAAKKVKTLKPAAKANVQVKQVQVLSDSEITLNERILEEGPAALFESDKTENEDQSIVSSLIGAFRSMIYTFIGVSLGKS